MFGFRLRNFSFFLAVAILLIAGLVPLVGSAHSEVPGGVNEYDGLVAKTEAYLRLLPRAQEFGTLRVIVRLELTFVPESHHGNAFSILVQRTRIGQAQSAIQRSMNASNTRTARVFKHIPYMVMEVDGAALWDLIANPLVASIQEDVPVPLTLSQSVPLIGAEQAWDLGYSGQGQSIAILDTGVDSGHPFLAGKVVAEACFSTTYAGLGSTTVCPNGQEEQVGAGAAAICSAGGCDHGTHIAGVAAGQGSSLSGVAPDATILAVQVFSRFNHDQCQVYGFSGDCVLSYPSDQISALEWVYEQRSNFAIAAANISLGGGRYTDGCDSDPRKAIIDTLRAVGIATIVSSANNGYVDALGIPSCISSVISVGASSNQDEVTSFSNVSQYLDLLAPGLSIQSSIPGGGYQAWDGTSLAAPHVAGAWAVLKSLDPDATVDDVLAALSDTGLPVADSRPGGSIVVPRIRVDLALLDLQANLPATATPTATETTVPTATPSATLTPSPTPTVTESPSPTATSEQDQTPTATATATVLSSATPTSTSQAPTATPTPTPEPAGDTKWYLAEGYTGGGAETFILIQNPNSQPVTVFVTYQLQEGGENVRQHIVAPHSRYTVAAHSPTEVGLGVAFSALVESDLPIIVERAMYFANGGHNSLAATVPSTIWYLAEGYTGDGFETYILIQNPTDAPTTVRVSYLLEQGGTIEREHIVGALERYTIVAGALDEVGIDQAFSTVINSDLPVIVERSMYFPLGGHNTFAVTHPVITWYLAEGSTEQEFETFILIQNPQQTEANLEVTYQMPDGSEITTQHLVQPMSRMTINAGAPTEIGPDRTFSTIVTSDVPVVVERAMYFATGGHSTIGATAPATSWFLAEGFTGEGFGTQLSIQNPNADEAAVVISYLMDDGEHFEKQHLIAAHSRYTIRVHDVDELGPGVAFSTRVTSDIPVVVERAMYFETGGHVSGAMRGAH